MLPALATVIAAFPFLIAAAPQPGAGVGVKIPISKRSTISNPDGSVNIPALCSHVAQTKGKFESGFERYERNTGSPHPLATKGTKKRGSASEPLTNDHNQLWYGEIAVGTPARKYTVDFDTGSSDLVLPGPQCGASCAGHAIYNPGLSSTSRDLNRTFDLTYGDNSTVSGEQYTDTVTIAGLTATNQTLGAATQYSDGFKIQNFLPDGLMGMAFKALAEYTANPVFQSLVAQGQSSQPVFAFKLAATGSELFLGGTNPALYTGDFTYVNGYWQVPLDAVSSDDNAVLTNLDSIIDTGTSLIVGDTTSVAAFYKAIGGEDASKTVGAGFYTFPCKDVPKVSLTFGGKAFPISPGTFNLGQTSHGSSSCVGGIMAQDGIGFWVIGDVFLANVYSSFNISDAIVGFADLR
ncbi:acid protease [Leucogyrophana mollusca]|uniref:Acid protease n=1 Tax=Leucogyrophana mollusca TaxID=85980 RepID=A0ACB8B0Q1_9AGAM|nr:acid protease [Leucogyrophana mollusca]